MKEKIISTEIYHQIIDFETNKKNKLKINVFFLGIIIIGFLSISLGILSIVAANWSEIPYYIKILVLFLLQAFVGHFYFKIEKKIYKEGLLILFIFLMLIILSLLSQIFQLEGKLYELFLFWGFLSLSPMILAEVVFTPVVIFFNLYFSSFFLIKDLHFLKSYETFYLTEYLF